MLQPKKRVGWTCYRNSAFGQITSIFVVWFGGVAKACRTGDAKVAGLIPSRGTAR